MQHLTGILGFFLLLGIAFALSSNRKAIRWQTVSSSVISIAIARHLQASPGPHRY
jgi:nucleoside permease NupC